MAKTTNISKVVSFIIVGILGHLMFVSPTMAQEPDDLPFKLFMPFAQGGQNQFSLNGNGDDLVAEAIPDLEFIPREEDYLNDHPDVPGVYLSFNTLLLVFQADT
ncbi:MAG: hypothetical protein AAF629_26220, partial [Chloroflexota bacterium]